MAGLIDPGAAAGWFIPRLGLLLLALSLAATLTAAPAGGRVQRVRVLLPGNERVARLRLPPSDDRHGGFICFWLAASQCRNLLCSATYYYKGAEMGMCRPIHVGFLC